MDYIRKCQAIGYTDQYRIQDEKLINVNSKKKYEPEDILILKEHRYEGMSNPSDTSLLYVIETSDGSKGSILANYGANADNSIHEFMNSIPKMNISDKNMLPRDTIP